MSKKSKIPSERPPTAIEMASLKARSAGPTDQAGVQLTATASMTLPALTANIRMGETRQISSMGTLGEFVAARRKAKKLNQQDFADLAGVGRRFISEIEGGKETAQIGKILKVLNTLGIDLIVRDR